MSQFSANVNGKGHLTFWEEQLKELRNWLRRQGPQEIAGGTPACRNLRTRFAEISSPDLRLVLFQGDYSAISAAA